MLSSSTYTTVRPSVASDARKTTSPLMMSSCSGTILSIFCDLREIQRRYCRLYPDYLWRSFCPQSSVEHFDFRIHQMHVCCQNWPGLTWTPRPYRHTVLTLSRCLAWIARDKLNIKPMVGTCRKITISAPAPELETSRHERWKKNLPKKSANSRKSSITPTFM